MCVRVCVRPNPAWFPVSLLQYNQRFLLDFKVKIHGFHYGNTEYKKIDP